MQCWHTTIESQRPEALARAIGSDARWPDDALIAWRCDPPSIAICGSFDQETLGLLSILGSQLELTLPHIRLWNWDDVARAARDLAGRLQDIEEPGDHNAIVAVPRGGLIVGGLVAYAANRPIAPDVGSARSGSWMIDDVSISGLRLLSELDRLPAKSILVGVLAATDGAVEVVRAHPAVLGFERVERVEELAAAENQHASEDRGKSRWPEFDSRIWIGRAAHHVFPWNEPDSSFRHPVTRRVEPGFPLVPREQCYSNREPLRPVVPVIESLVPLLAPGVWPIEHSGSLLLLHPASGAVAEAAESAVELLGVLASPDPNAAIKALATELQADAGEIRADLDELLQTLQSCGYMTPDRVLPPVAGGAK